MSVSKRVIQGLLLAVALVVATAPSTWAQSKSKNRSQAGWLGVSIQDVTEDLKQSLPRGITEGALVNGVVDGSPAETAGLTEGDVIVKFEQTRVHNSGDLTDAVRNSRPGQTANIEYYRDGNRMTAQATLTKNENAMVWQPRGRERGKRSGHEGGRDMYFFDDNAPHAFGMMAGSTPRLGVELMELNDQLSAYFGVKSGVLITNVVEESAAETAGLLAGDVITAVSGEPTKDAQDVREELSDIETGPVEITVIRKGQEETITAQLAAPKRARLSGFHGPSAPMFNIPDVSWDQEEFKAQMEQLQEEMKQLQKELSDLRDDSR